MFNKYFIMPSSGASLAADTNTIDAGFQQDTQLFWTTFRTTEYHGLPVAGKCVSDAFVFVLVEGDHSPHVAT